MMGVDKMIFLWGFMGSGKTSLGQLLAQKLNIEFLDLDELISIDQNSSIDEIFKTKGEEYFRYCEKQKINELLSKNIISVVACGGGTPCFNNLHDLMNKNGHTIYLDCDVANLSKRLFQDHNIRPLLQKLSQDEIFGFVDRLLSKRDEYYRSATSIMPNNGAVEEAVDLILKKLNY